MFSYMGEIPEGDCPAISSWPSAQANAYNAVGHWSETTHQVNLK